MSLDRKLLEQAAKDSASASRCAHRIEEALGEYLASIRAGMDSLPPMRPKAATHPEFTSGPDASQQLKPVVTEIVKSDREQAELAEMRKGRERLATIFIAIAGAVGGAVGIKVIEAVFGAVVHH